MGNYKGRGPAQKNREPGRMIWNIETPDVKGEFAKLKAAGASVVREPYQMGDGPKIWIATFADPDNNYFQLMSPIDIPAAAEAMAGSGKQSV